MKFYYDQKYGGIRMVPDCADDWLELIWALGVDYDGCHQEEDLKRLIDELVDMAQKARMCLRDGKIFENEEETDRSYEEACAERNRLKYGETICSE